jgi:hypothetical protein
MAGGAGFEPRLTESESAVLPLNYLPRRLVRPVDFRKERRENRRSGWHLDDLDDGARRLRQIGHTMPKVERNGVARPRPLALWQKVDLEIALRRAASQDTGDPVHPSR